MPEKPEPDLGKPSSRIESIGIALPLREKSSTELVKKLPVGSRIKLELLTGIHSRRMCSEGEDSLSLALGAAEDCLKHSKYKASDLDVIISCSITSYNGQLEQIYEPSMAFLIASGLGAVQAEVFDLSNACAGMITGLLTAHNLIEAGSAKTIMIVSGEYITSLTENAIRNIKTTKSKEVASLTVGDSGAAVIIESADVPGGNIRIGKFVTLSQYNDLCTAKPGRKSPGAAMKTKAAKIHEVSIDQSPTLVKDSLNMLNMTYSDIDFLIPHQTSRLAIRSGAHHFEAFFDSKPGEVVVNLKDFGNTSTTTHFLALYSYLIAKKFKSGDQVMLLSYASGLTIGVIVLTIDHLIEQYGS